MKCILAFLLVPVLAFAQMAHIRDVTIDTNGVAVATFEDVRGVLDAIYVEGVTTSAVVIAYSPRGTEMDITMVSSNDVAQTASYYPAKRSVNTANAGVDDYTKYVFAGEPVRVSFTNGVSNAVFRVVLKKE